MMKPRPHKRERARLASLRALDILDTPAEEVFNDIARLAAKVCKTSIGLVTLVDRDRQWFKARVGISASQTPRDISFCGHAINRGGIFEIRNAKKDRRFHDNPLVKGAPHFAYYAGVPFNSKLGLPMGTLCVIDSKPRSLSDLQKKVLKALAREVETQMELRRLSKRLLLSASEMRQKAKLIKIQEGRILKSAKLSALGYMAAGIAHEINNPLGTISLASMAIRRALPDAPDVSESIKGYCETISDTVVRISSIINSLRSLARDASGDPPRNEDLAEVIENSLSICREKFSVANIRVLVEVPVGTCLKCRKGEITQVLINLLENSYFATKSCKRDRWIRIVAESDQGKLTLSVIDSGDGVPVKFQKSLFQPFFTTKPAGVGTGLGLAISSKLVAHNGGQLSYRAKSEHTRFDMVFGS